jgi:hypothetical protein
MNIHASTSEYIYIYIHMYIYIHLIFNNSHRYIYIYIYIYTYIPVSKWEKYFSLSLSLSHTHTHTHTHRYLHGRCFREATAGRARWYCRWSQLRRCLEWSLSWVPCRAGVSRELCVCMYVCMYVFGLSSSNFVLMPWYTYVCMYVCMYVYVSEVFCGCKQCVACVCRFSHALSWSVSVYVI